MAPESADVVVVGAGAAGLATAIFSRRGERPPSVVLLDGAKKPGAKILVSGGSRCNVTNRVVADTDFWGGRRTIIRRVLRAFTARQAVEWFADLGIALHEETDGKLFPDSNRSRDVLAALLRAASSAGVELLADHRVGAIERDGDRFRVVTPRGVIAARRVVLATGGQSLPKSGSDGAGFELAARFGHRIVPTTPGLAPLVLESSASPEVAPERESAGALPASPRPPWQMFPPGVSHEAELSVWADGRVAARLRGPLLWTHFGISGPVALNASRHWLRAQLESRAPRLTVNFAPGETFDTLEQYLLATRTARPKLSIGAALAEHLPASVAATLLARLRVDASSELAHLARDDRRRIIAALIESPLPVTGSRGYNYAEVTAGGVALEEIDPSTMESRVRPGLYLVGEILDVDGRLGGFNFQWAWSSAWVAGRALTRG